MKSMPKMIRRMMKRSGSAAKKLGTQQGAMPPMRRSIKRMMMRSGAAMKGMRKPSPGVQGFVQNERAMNERIMRSMKK